MAPKILARGATRAALGWRSTDLEFLLERAARIGYEVFADDTTVHFQHRREARPIAAGCGAGDVRLTAFRVWLSPPRATEVTVRAWDVVGKEALTGRARQPVIALLPARRGPK